MVFIYLFISESIRPWKSKMTGLGVEKEGMAFQIYKQKVIANAQEMQFPGSTAPCQVGHWDAQSWLSMTAQVLCCSLALPVLHTSWVSCSWFRRSSSSKMTLSLEQLPTRAR